jgi:hypothetical protein
MEELARCFLLTVRELVGVHILAGADVAGPTKLRDYLCVNSKRR